jgi:hypothetical protein
VQFASGASVLAFFWDCDHPLLLVLISGSHLLKLLLILVLRAHLGVRVKLNSL